MAILRCINIDSNTNDNTSNNDDGKSRYFLISEQTTETF